MIKDVNIHGQKLFSILICPGWESYNLSRFFVTGVVNIQAHNPIDAMGLYLHFTGKEFTQWQESYTETSTDSDGISTSTTRTVVYSGRQVILANFFLLHHFDRTLQKASSRFLLNWEFLNQYHHHSTMKGVIAKRYHTIKAKVHGVRSWRLPIAKCGFQTCWRIWIMLYPRMGELWWRLEIGVVVGTIHR